MCAEALTQDEIDALLRGETLPDASSKDSGGAALAAEEEETVKSFSSIVSNSGMDVLGALMGGDVSFEVEEYKEIEASAIAEEIEGDLVTAALNYKGMVEGQSLIVISVENALKIASEMTGGGAESEFGDLEESAYSEAIQNIFSSTNTQLAQQVGGEISLDPPEIVCKPPDLTVLVPESSEPAVLVKYSLESASMSGPLYQIIPRNLLKSISHASIPAPESAGEVMSDLGGLEDFDMGGGPPIMSQPAQFAPAGGEQQYTGAAPSVDITNLDLILDISVEVKVELGKTARKIKEVLEMGPGSVVELDRLAGEPVDILVNDKLFAKGEVVVIDENFGVRITDILSIQERIEALK